MQALILVGGYGTRLRPLTFSCPKSIVEFVNQPILSYQIQALQKIGVKEIVLAVCFQPDKIIPYMKEFQEKYGVKVACSHEEEPLGTAGPIRLAQNLLVQDNTENTFFVFNSDVTCSFPLEDLLQFHRSHGQQGTIMLTKVQDPSKYGVILSTPQGRIQQFIEKPKELISNRINAGIYVFNTQMIDRIPENQPTSIETETFPSMVKEGQLYCMDLPDFWMDIGQPADYLQGQALYLAYLRKTQSTELAVGPNIQGDVVIHPTATVSQDAIIGPNVVIGENCVVEQGVRLKNVTLLKKSKVQQFSWISETIIGWYSIIGQWVRIQGLTVLGEDVAIKDELFINNASIMPHKSIGTNVEIKGSILM